MCPRPSLSLGYKISESCEKGPDREAGGDSLWKGGAQAEEKGVVPELPAGSQCPELAQHVDTEPVPDLKPPSQPEGKR